MAQIEQAIPDEVMPRGEIVEIPVFPPHGKAAPVPVSEESTSNSVQTACLVILTTIAVGVTLWLLKPVLVPFVLALFFTYFLTPIIDLQVRRWHVPNWLAIASTALLGVAAMALAGFIVAGAVGSMSRDFPEYRQRVNELTEGFLHHLPLATLGIHSDPQAGAALRLPEQASTSFVSAVLGATMDVVANGLLVLVFMIFLLLGRHQLPDAGAGLMWEVESRVKRYIGKIIFISIVTGLLVGGVLGALGVEFAAVFGFLAIVLNFIPNVGSIIATVLPLPLILLSPDMSMLAKVMAIAIPAAIQVTIGTFVQPKILGDALDLHPIAVLLAMVFFGTIWGIVGAFLATPALVVVKIVLERRQQTLPLARLIAGDITMISRRE